MKADCLSVMNINGLQVSLPSYGSALWEGGGTASLPPLFTDLHQNTVGMGLLSFQY